MYNFHSYVTTFKLLSKEQFFCTDVTINKLFAVLGEAGIKE